MKNIMKVIALVGIVSLAASCKTHEKCPAFGKYGKIDTKKTISAQEANS